MRFPPSSGDGTAPDIARFQPRFVSGPFFLTSRDELPGPERGGVSLHAAFMAYAVRFSISLWLESFRYERWHSLLQHVSPQRLAGANYSPTRCEDAFFCFRRSAPCGAPTKLRKWTPSVAFSGAGACVLPSWNFWLCGTTRGGFFSAQSTSYEFLAPVTYPF